MMKLPRDVMIFEFGDITVDVDRMTVVRAGSAVDLEPKAFDVLRFLIEHRDRLVTKEELLDAVWKDTFVTPNVLTRAVAQLRKAIGDDAHESRFIETVARRGYRFIAAPGSAQPAAALEVEAPPTLAPVPRPRATRYWKAAAAALVLLAMAAVVFMAWSRRADPAASPATFLSVKRILGGGPGYMAYPSFSPDAQSIAYTSDRTGALEIYVRSLTPGSREIAITADGAQNEKPNWSPDGRWIAFHSQTHGGVWIAPSTGGVPRQVIEFGSWPAWSPDSQWIALTSDEGSMAAQATIWIARFDGTERRQLTKLGSPAGGHQMPSWSHDGRYVVFAKMTGGSTSEMWVVDVQNGALKNLESSPFAGGEIGGSPRFAPDDRAVYYTGITADGNGRIYKVTLDRETLGITGPPQSVVGYDAMLGAGLTVARDGTAAYGLYQEDSNLWAVDWPAAGEPRRLTDGKRNFRASYSRQGRVVYMNQEVGQGFTTWLMNGDGTGREPLVPDLQGFSPQWSPDGQRVLVRKSGDIKDRSFVWVDVVTRRTTPATLGVTNMAEVRLSPMADQIAFHVIGDNGALNLWTEPLDGARARPITFDREAISYPTWSPDGQFIAAEMKRGNDTHIVVVPATGGDVEQLTFEHGQSWANAWSPDGEWIAFAGERAGVWNLWAVSRRTRETRQLTHFTTPIGYVRWPTWSPDGRQIIFERSQARGDIWTTKFP